MENNLDTSIDPIILLKKHNQLLYNSLQNVKRYVEERIESCEDLRGKDHYCHPDGNCDGLCSDIYWMSQELYEIDQALNFKKNLQKIWRD